MTGTSLPSGRARALAVLLSILVAPDALPAPDEAPPADVAGPPADAAPPSDTAAAPATAAPAAAAAPPADADEALPAIDEIVIVGRRKRAEVERDPTASATVIDASRFAGEAKGAAELVSTAPGVAVNEYGGLGHFTTVSLRGAAADGVLVLLDGIPLETAFGGGVNLASIPRQWIDRVEVVRGVEGAHYGAGALGGVVNVVTRSRASGWSAETTGGSYGTYAASGEGAFSAGGWAGLVAASGEGSAGDYHYDFNPARTGGTSDVREVLRTNDAVRRGGLVLKLSSPAGTSRVDTVAMLSGGRRELPGWPYRLTPQDWQEDGRALLAARFSTPGPWDGVLLAARASVRGDWLATRIDPAVIEQRGGAAGAGGEARILHRGGQLRVTLETAGETIRGDGFVETRSRSVLAAALADDVFFGRVRLSPAVRAERVGSFTGMSAKLGGSLHLVGPLALRASGGRTFRAPTLSELYLTQGIVQPNPALRSEEGLGGDAALVVDVPTVHASVGTFTTVYRDLIWYQQASGGRLKPQNSGKVLARGLELEVATAPARQLLGLSVAAAYTFLDTENLRGSEATLGNELPRRARHRWYARTSVEPGRFGAHVEAQHVGRQFADLQNLEGGAIGAVTTWNAGGSVRLSPRGNVALHAQVRNLLDDRTLRDALDSPLPGRMVLVTLRAGSGGTEVAR